jgi:hypothetical protein
MVQATTNASFFLLSCIVLARDKHSGQTNRPTQHVSLLLLSGIELTDAYTPGENKLTLYPEILNTDFDYIFLLHANSFAGDAHCVVAVRIMVPCRSFGPLVRSRPATWRAIKFRPVKLTRSRSASRLDDRKSGLEVDQQREQIGYCLGISVSRDLVVLHCIRECSLS